jgi:hypothetical protein
MSSSLTGAAGLSRSSLPIDGPALWKSDPVQAFECLRDWVREAMACVIDVHVALESGLKAPSLATIRPDRHERLFVSIDRAQDIWVDVPEVRRYIDRTHPVYLDQNPNRTANRLSGSSYHGLCLLIAMQLLEQIRRGYTVGDWLAIMRFYAAVGDAVAARFAALVPEVECECTNSISRLEASISADGPIHAPDFSWVRCSHGNFVFTPNQRPIVRELWNDWTINGLGLGQVYLVEKSGSELNRLGQIFKSHAAWGTLIAAAELKDTFRLDLPPRESSASKLLSTRAKTPS